MTSVLASAPANLFLTGEHAVVYGYPAIIVAVQKRVYVTATAFNSAGIKVISDIYGTREYTISGALQEVPYASDPLYPSAKLCASILQKKQITAGLRIDIKSEIPPESGMSSSSAVLAAVYSSVCSLVSFDEVAWYDLLYPLQVWIHGGKASGSELFSSVEGNVHTFRKVINPEGEVRAESRMLKTRRFNVVIGDTLVRAPTALPVGIHIPSLMKRRPESVKECYKKISQCSDNVIKALKDGDPCALGRTMNENQDVLQDLMVSHPKLDDAIAEARSAGAYGAKLSGAGWGGVMFALVNRESESSVIKAIESTGCKAFSAEIAGPGCRVESTGDIA